MSPRRLAAVVLARDRPEQTKRTLDALLAQEPPADVLLLVANEATPEVSRLLAEAADAHPDASVLRLPRNRGCAGGYAAGISHLLQRADLDYICGFDDDATPQPGCLGALLEAAASLPDAAEIGAMAHDEHGVLAWPVHPAGGGEPLSTVGEVEEVARGEPLKVFNMAWQGLVLPVDVLRRHGNVWGELFLQYEDIELGLRYRDAGLACYLAPRARCLHPAPPPARSISLFGRSIDVTRQTPAKEYLTLRNGLVVWRRYDGLRFWYGTGPFVVIRGLLSSLALGVPRRAALRHVFLRGLVDAARGRLGPPPPATVKLAEPRRSP